MRMTRIGIDTGGTFTDVVVLRAGRLEVHKVPSTPKQPGAAVVAGIEAATLHTAADIVHGTTVGLNAVLTGTTAKVAFVTNDGFVDLIEIGRQARADLYDLAAFKATPPVPRSLRLTLDHRRHADGVLERRPTAEALAQLRDRVRRSGAQAVAIGLLHSHRHPGDERAVANALASLGLPVTCSAELAPIQGEYERFATAILNAGIAPGMGAYIAELAAQVAPGRLRLMRSSGGVMPAHEAVAFPARAVFSGPAGGVLAAQRIRERLKVPKLLTLDMGGTSTDVSLLGKDPPLFDERSLGGLPLAVPAVDVHTVGCGGGSIAVADPGGGLRVGPESAGADPGPACYGGGDEPTVTDAHVALGHIGADTLLGGGFPIDPDRAVQAIERLARRLGLSTLRCAEGILEVAEVTMLRALLVMTVERAVEPADVVLLAFGGAGGLHAAGLQRRLALAGAFVPTHPGAFSAIGLALAGETVEQTLPVFARCTTKDLGVLRRRAKGILMDLQASLKGEVKGRIRCTVTARLRFVGQGSCLEVPFTPDAEARFRGRHQHLFGFAPEAEVEWVDLRCRCEAAGPRFPPSLAPTGTPHWRLRQGPLRGRCWQVATRDSLPATAVLKGPCLVEERTGVTLVPAGHRAVVTPVGLQLLAR